MLIGLFDNLIRQMTATLMLYREFIAPNLGARWAAGKLTQKIKPIEEREPARQTSLRF